MLGIIHRLSTELSAGLPSTQERFDFQPLFSRWRKQFLKIKRNVNPGQENNLSFFNRVSSFQESPERSEYRHNFKNFNQMRTHDAINESWRRWRSILRGSLHEYNRAKSEYNLWCMKKKWMQFFFLPHLRSSRGQSARCFGTSCPSQMFTCCSGLLFE